MDRKVKWGILGPGKIARSFASDFQFVQSGELVAVASRSIERANSFANEFSIPKRYNSYEEMLADEEIDAIYIATPHNFHFEQTKACLHAGKSVLCEKPITTSPTQLKELIRLQASTNRFLMEGMWTYFLPALNKAREWVAEGKIGQIKEVTANFGFPAEFNPNGRLFNPDLAGGAVFDLGIYPIAFATLFLGYSPIEVESYVQRASTGVDDDVKMKLKYANGSQAFLHCSFRSELSNSAEIYGEKGRIFLPLFWMGSECRLELENDDVETFHDDRKSRGYDYETESVSKDILLEKTESSIVPLSTSMIFQELMARVLSK